MSEDTKTPNKPFKVHVLNLVAGGVGAALCFGFVLLAKHIGLQLSELTQEGLIIGGALSAGVSIYGAKQLPGKGQ